MSDGDLRGRVLQALAGVRHPEIGRDIVGSGHVQGLEISEFSREKMSATEQELSEERDAVKHLFS